MILSKFGRRGVLRSLVGVTALFMSWPVAFAQQSDRNPVVHKVDSAFDRLEMVVNSSRILTLDQQIPRAQVNNPDMMTLTPLSPNQVQISAKKSGVTEVNLWTKNPQTGAEEIHTVDVIVYGDARELERIIKSQFPSANVNVYPTASSVILKGYVDRTDDVNHIIRIAEDYYPKVISNITVGGVQQVLLHVKVMEVSRTKLRQLGFDFSNINGQNFVVSSVSGLIAASANGAAATGTGNDTVRFGVIDGKNSFFGFLNALRQYDLAKVLAEPDLVAESGRPASFNSGGEIPVLIPAGLGTVSVEYKPYGTQIDFVPIVLGNGNIHLEVRPNISEIDDTRSVTLSGTTIPALRVRRADTAVEMKAGQTFAIAGLVQTRTESTNAGLPFLADLPYFGVPFRRVKEVSNEVELVILVQPELVAPLDACEVPHVGPGLQTTSPSDCELYFKGHLEVPACRMPGAPPQRASVYEEVPSGAVPGTPSTRTNPAGVPTAGHPAGRSVAGNTSTATDRPFVAENVSTRRIIATDGTDSPSGPANRNNPPKPSEPTASQPSRAMPAFIGPLGYDVNNSGKSCRAPLT